jgi:hypothetical protein
VAAPDASTLRWRGLRVQKNHDPLAVVPGSITFLAGKAVLALALIDDDNFIVVRLIVLLPEGREAPQAHEVVKTS